MQWQGSLDNKKISPDDTRLVSILKGCLTGALAGLVASVFRLAIVQSLKLVTIVMIKFPTIGLYCQFGYWSCWVWLL